MDQAYRDDRVALLDGLVDELEFVVVEVGADGEPDLILAA